MVVGVRAHIAWQAGRNTEHGRKLDIESLAPTFYGHAAIASIAGWTKEQVYLPLRITLLSGNELYRAAARNLQIAYRSVCQQGYAEPTVGCYDPGCIQQVESHSSIRANEEAELTEQKPRRLRFERYPIRTFAQIPCRDIQIYGRPACGYDRQVEKAGVQFAPVYANRRPVCRIGAAGLPQPGELKRAVERFSIDAKVVLHPTVNNGRKSLLFRAKRVSEIMQGYFGPVPAIFLALEQIYFK
jgi:hypothetical protein